MIRDTNAGGEYRYRPILGTTRDGSYADGPTISVKHSFGVAAQKSVKETGLIIQFILKQLKKLVVGEAAVHKNIGGKPIEIVRQASDAAEKGVYAWVQLMSLISISLGVMNLLPIPVLDGGQLLFYLFELVRGKPLPIRWRADSTDSSSFLIFFMLFVVVFDIERWISGG